MDFKLFTTVFAAELDDKTQLTAVLYAADAEHPKLTVFAAAAAALVISSALGVLGGAVLWEFVNPKMLRWIAGIGFIAVGCWVLVARD